MKEPFLEKSEFQKMFQVSLDYLIDLLNDYQFNREENDYYLGAINLGSYQVQKSDQFEFIVKYHKLFEPFMEAQGYKFEKVIPSETIIVHINPGVVEKEKYTFSMKFLNKDLEFRNAIDFFDDIENGVMDKVVDRLIDYSENPFISAQILSGFVSLDQEFTFEDVKEWIGKEAFETLKKTGYLEKVEKRSLVS